MTAAMIGILTISSFDATTPEEAWPLAPPSESDLAWLKMSDGKKEVFKLTQQADIEPTPLFRRLAALYTNSYQPNPTTPLPKSVKASLPDEMYHLYNISPSTKADETDDPLQWASARLAQVIGSDNADPVVVIGFLMLISAMRPDFKQLLLNKEPRALLLLAWWYAKTSQLGLWWLERRSRLEGQAICIYLDQRYPDDEDMQALLQYPKRCFERMAGR